MTLTSSMEDYLEAILVIRQKRGTVRCVDISEQLRVTKPSVSRAVKELAKGGYLVKSEDGTISLTSLGEQTAAMIYERHRFFKQQLIDLGVDPETAETDACRMEHGVSKESFAKLKAKYQKET